MEKKSKRQVQREKIEIQKQRNRLITIGLITLGAILLVFAFVAPTLRGVGEIVTVTPASLPNANGLTIGEPDAPVTVDIFEDFQCSACRYFSESIEPLIIQNLVATGKAKYTFHNYPFLDGNGVAAASQTRLPMHPCAPMNRENSGRCIPSYLPIGTAKISGILAMLG
jgi:protein-disulfide isomerase